MWSKQIQMHFRRSTKELIDEITRNWLCRVKSEVKSFLQPAEDNTIRTNYVKVKVDKLRKNRKYRIRG